MMKMLIVVVVDSFMIMVVIVAVVIAIVRRGTIASVFHKQSLVRLTAALLQ